MHLYLIAFLVLATSTAWADRVLQLGTGILSFEAFKHTTDKTASLSKLGTNYTLPLQVQTRLSIMDRAFAPRLLYTLISKESKDKGSTSSILLASLPWVHSVGPDLDFSAGLGYMSRSIKGKGGTTELGNGAGTSTFGLPAQTRTSSNFHLESGIHYRSDPYVLSLEAMLVSAFSERRSLSILLTLNYRF